MKKFTLLIVLLLGLSAASEIKAQEPTPTPILSVANLLPPSVVRLGDGQDVVYGIFIFQNSYTIPVEDVVLTAALPANLTFTSATSTHGSCTEANKQITCNLGKLIKYYSDYTAIVRIFARPTADGAATINGKVKGSNTSEATFSQTKTIAPPKSRTRIKFF